MIDIKTIDDDIDNINYSFAQSPFGDIIIASTNIGICHLFFDDDQDNALCVLKQRFPNSQYQYHQDMMQQNAINLFQQKQEYNITLHVKGSDFQVKTWRELLKIPIGRLVHYSDIANNINQPNASRAVGSAVGKNPVAFLIPCHRVVPKNGNIGNYMWGSQRKQTIIKWEQQEK